MVHACKFLKLQDLLVIRVFEKKRVSDLLFYFLCQSSNFRTEICKFMIHLSISNQFMVLPKKKKKSVHGPSIVGPITSSVWLFEILGSYGTKLKARSNTKQKKCSLHMF